MRFDIVDLKLFTHIAEANSLTRGAERAHLSVPAASTRIKHLEEQVSVTPWATRCSRMRAACCASSSN